MRRTLLLYCLLLFAGTLTAQKKIVLEKVRYRTAFNYLGQREMPQLLARHLNTLLLQYHKQPLADTNSIPLQQITSNKELNQKYDYQNTDTSLLHLVIDIIEVSPENFLPPPETAADSATRSSAKTMFYLNTRLIDAWNNFHYNKTLLLLLKDHPGPGMGHESRNVPIHPKTFVEVIRSGLAIAFDPGNEQALVAVSMAPPFQMDDYLAPALMGKKRIFVDTSKGFYRFTYQGNAQVLRRETPWAEELIWKGRQARPYPQQLLQVIKSSPGYNNATFLLLHNECRDVFNDKNYQAILMVQIEHEQTSYIFDPFHSFMPGNRHVLLYEKDTLALFSINKDVPDTSKNIFPTRIYNGLDTNSAITVNYSESSGQIVNTTLTERSPKLTAAFLHPLYRYVLKGKIKGQAFTIKCGGINGELREYYLGDQLVCVTQGKKAPEKFVVFDASLQSEILNPLLLIGFNPYFLE